MARGPLVVGHADADVLDADQEAARLPGRQVAADQHGPRRGRERGGVLDQLGEEVGDVGHRPARDLEVVVDLDVDPPVLLALGSSGADDLGQRHRPAPEARRLVARQHEQRLGVAPDARGQVVELEQLVEDVGLAFPLLEVGDQARAGGSGATGSAGPG